MQMPVMGGIEAAKIFRFMYPNNNIPIIMLTANATKEAIDACEEAKLDAYLTKPVEPERLLNTINLLIRKKESKIFSNTENKTNIIDINDPENLPIIDIKSLDSLASMSENKNFMVDLINGYINDAIINLENMDISIRNSEYQKVANIAHALDGSSRSLGAKRIAKLADNIFRLAQKENHDYIPDYITELKGVFQDTENSLRSYLKNKKKSII